MFKKITAILLTVCLLVSFSGCGFIMNKIETSKIESMVNASLEEFFKTKGDYDLNSVSKKKYDLSDLVDEQKALESYVISKCSGFEIKSITVSDSRDSAQCNVEIYKVPDLSALDTLIATSDEYKDEINSLKKKTVKLNFKMVKNKNDEWIFADLTKLFDSFVTPLKELCIIDEEGRPINITQAYIDQFFQESVWYDPLMGNPTSSESFTAPVALANYFYFKQPMDLDLTAVLYKDDEEIGRRDLTLDSAVIAKCEFDASVTIDSSTFSSGSYKIVIYSGDVAIAESSDIRVR